MWECAHKFRVQRGCSMCSARSWSRKSRKVLHKSEAVRAREPKWYNTLYLLGASVSAIIVTATHLCAQLFAIAAINSVALALNIWTTRRSQICALGNWIYYMASARRPLYSFAWNVLECRSLKLHSEEIRKRSNAKHTTRKRKNKYNNFLLYYM